MSENPFKKLLKKPEQEPIATGNLTEPDMDSTTPKRGRGRPATGKRSDPDWIGRTFYVRSETDIDVEVHLAQIRRQGVELDKSELVDSLLVAWVKWQQGEDANLLLDKISPRQK